MPPPPLPGGRFLAPGIAAALERLGTGGGRRPLALTGLTPGVLPFLVALLPRALGRTVAFVTATREEAEALVQDAPFWAHALGAPAARPLLLPALEPEPYLGVSPHLQVVVDRAAVLHAALGGQAAAILLPAEALLLRVPRPDCFRSMVRSVGLGDRIDRDPLVRDLVRFGYRRQDLVGSTGELAVRGGVLDVWSPATSDPYRLELFGDEVQSIRHFDPVTQRSAEELTSAVFLPLLPFPIEADADELLRAWGTGLPDAQLPALRARREELRTRGSFPGIEYWAPVLAAPLVSVTECLGDVLLAVIEPEAVSGAIERASASLEEAHGEAAARGSAVPPPAELALAPAELSALVASAPLALTALAQGKGNEVAFRTRPSTRYEGRIKDLVRDLAAGREQGTDAVVVMPTPGEADRVEAMLSEYQIPYLEGDHAASVFRQDSPIGGMGRVAVSAGRLAQGFHAPELALAVYTAPEIFGGALPPNRRRRTRAASFSSDFRDLKIGDHVVHVDHGIARFQGLKHVEAGGVAQEFMVLSYADDDRLYVPLDRLDLIQKFSGVEGARPRIDSLGSKSWANVKKRVKEEIREMAQELLRLYAARRVIRGHAFSPDGLFQKEFEDAFPFTETPDQAQAIADVKKDMESERCMDRLLCGDVGYGKTEVAMRAAFKSVADGKQVAVLTPTTVLTFQHFRTFSERFHAFPVAIGTVSRFRSKAQIDATLGELAAGKVDVLIGTHRLLSKDVQFRDLGLLIIDEEQRFGVTHKEKLKQLRQGIDVLSMSATPIPRTLQMSLAGLRDMSVIETPPKDRLAIETAVLRFEGKAVKEAIKREMERGGQIFFIHNRVESIYAMADTLRKIAPFARVTVAHGQMKEHELEDAMMTFAERKSDILLATTIIENGIDLPNVNTIFMNRAHRLGLAQLYQLRGRVGRSDKPAYAYLLVPRDVTLSPVARRRLHAIQEFTDLGSGFRIAALDLELRGAGSVLGREQHGHIAAVGFDLYMDLLEQAVREHRGEAVETTATTVALGLDVHLPESWIDDQNQRLMVYKRVASLKSLDDAADLEKEIADRFGALPQPVSNLIDAARLKIEAQELGIAAVEREGKLLRFRLGPLPRLAPDKVVRFASAAPGRKVYPDGRIEMPAGAGRLALDQARGALAELR